MEHGLAPVAVYTQPDRPAGRGRQLTASAVKRSALAHGLPVVQPESLDTVADVATLAALEPDIMVVVAYGQLLAPRVLALPPHGCINVHASLLPRWRGAAPIQRALLAGDRETGVTIMQMVAKLDAGPVLLARPIAIHESDTAGTLHDRLARLGADALVDALRGLSSGTLEATPQPAGGVTYAKKVDKQEAWLDWTLPATMLARCVRAYDPRPGARARLDGEAVHVWRARARAAMCDAPPGAIVAAGDAGIEVSAGEGTLLIEELQMPGRKRIAAADFARRRPLTDQRFE